MPSSSEFQEWLEWCLKFWLSLIPFGWNVSRIEAVKADHEHFDGTTDQGKILFSVGELEAEIFLNREHAKFQGEDWDGRVFSFVGHEIAHGVRHNTTEGFKAGLPKNMRDSFDEYEDDWCDIVDQIVFKLYPYLKLPKKVRRVRQ